MTTKHYPVNSDYCADCNTIGQHRTAQCPAAGHTGTMASHDATTYRATVDGIGDTRGQHVEVTVEAAHHDRFGDTHAPAAFVDGDAQLDAAGLRELAAACVDAADQLDQLTTIEGPAE